MMQQSENQTGPYLFFNFVSQAFIVLVIICVTLSAYFLNRAMPQTEEPRFYYNFALAESFGLYNYYVLIGVAIFKFLSIFLESKQASQKSNHKT